MIAQFGTRRNCFSQSLNFEITGGVMSNKNKSKLLKLVFIQPFYAATQGQEPDAMEDAANRYGRKGKVVQNTYEMVGQSIAMCVQYKQLIGELILVGHGSNFSFRIGSDFVSVSALTPGTKYYKPEVHFPLMQLAPYFHPSARIEIQQCKCSNSDEGKAVLQRLSLIHI